MNRNWKLQTFLRNLKVPCGGSVSSIGVNNKIWGGGKDGDTTLVEIGFVANIQIAIYVTFNGPSPEEQKHTLSVKENSDQIKLQERNQESLTDEANKLTSSISTLHVQLASSQNQIKQL